MLKQEIRRKITQNSILLENFGINDLAWNRNNAIKLINEIMTDKIGILGGDVYKLTSNRLESLYDNWSCEPKKDELEDAYYFRSKSESLKYIQNYPMQKDEEILFSITFTEHIN
jgi:hypothetical protein